MISLLKYKPTSKYSSIKITATFIALFLFGLLIGRSVTMHNIFIKSATPLWQSGNTLYGFAGSIPNWFKSRNSLLRETQTLQSELETLRLSVADLVALSYENQRLRAEIGIKPEENFIRAGILTRPPQIPFDTLVISKGKNDGVNVGDLVLVSNRLFAGAIVEMGEKSSIVRLNSSSGNSFGAFVARTGEAIEVRGVGGGNFAAKVLLEFDIMTGDVLVVSGDSNYILAVVGVLERDESSGTKNLLMSLPFNMANIESVFILK